MVAARDGSVQLATPSVLQIHMLKAMLRLLPQWHVLVVPRIATVWLDQGPVFATMDTVSLAPALRSFVLNAMS